MLALLERFYEPISGRITFDGVDIRDLSLSTLRGRMLGYISQEPEVSRLSSWLDAHRCFGYECFGKINSLARD